MRVAGRRAPVRTLMAVVVLLIGVLLAPVAVVATWAETGLVDTDSFVAEFAPLAADPAVQELVTDRTVTAISDALNIPGLTDDLFAGITGLGLPPRSTAALDLLRGPTVLGLQSIVRSRVGAFVESDRFADAWASALRLSHRQLVATMSGDPGSVLSLGATGELGLELGPIVAAVKMALVADGFGLAERIPVVSRTIPLTQIEALAEARIWYSLVVSVAPWLPWAALFFLVAGVLVARRRVHALVGATAGLAVALAVLLLLVGVATTVVVDTVSPGYLPADVARDLARGLFSGIRSTGWTGLALAAIVAVLAWLVGPFQTPRDIRRFARERLGSTAGTTGTD